MCGTQLPEKVPGCAVLLLEPSFCVEEKFMAPAHCRLHQRIVVYTSMCKDLSSLDMGVGL
jgi:hypothetical protein